MPQFNVGDRVRHREEGKIGEVYGVHPETIWVLWKGGGTPWNTLPSNLIPLPFVEGDRISIRKGVPSIGAGQSGTVLAVVDGFLWIQFDGIPTPATIRQENVVGFERNRERT